MRACTHKTHTHTHTHTRARARAYTGCFRKKVNNLGDESISHYKIYAKYSQTQLSDFIKMYSYVVTFNDIFRL